MNVDPDGLAAVSRSLDAGARRGLLPGGVRLVTGRVAVCALSEFPQGAVFDPSEWLACVRAAMTGPLSGVAILALDPHCVLRLAGLRLPPGTPDPGLVGRYLDFGHAVLAALVRSLGPALGREPGCDAPDLFEGALVPCVLSTHALPDTVVMSVALGFDVAEARLEGTAYLLLRPKLAGHLVDALVAHPAAA